MPFDMKHCVSIIETNRFQCLCVSVCWRLPGESDQELLCNQSVCLLLTNPDQPVQLDWAQLSWFHTDECRRKVCLEFKYIKVIRSPPTEPQHRWLQMRLAQRGAAPDSAHSFKRTQIHICKNKHNRMHNPGIDASAHLTLLT